MVVLTFTYFILVELNIFQSKMKKSEAEVIGQVLKGKKGKKPPGRPKRRTKRSIIQGGVEWTKCIIPYTLDESFNDTALTEGKLVRGSCWCRK